MVLPVFPRNIPYRERPKSPPFNFFGTARHFFRNFFFEIFFPQRVPPAFFDVLRQNGCWKIPKGSSFQFFSALWDFFPKIKKNFFFNFFMLCDRMDVEKPQRVPLSVFRHCETLARQGLALASPGAPLGPIFLVRNFFKKFFFQKISIFEYCKRVLDTWKSFCYFWALDMAPTWAGPGLFKYYPTIFLKLGFSDVQFSCFRISFFCFGYFLALYDNWKVSL